MKSWFNTIMLFTIPFFIGYFLHPIIGLISLIVLAIIIDFVEGNFKEIMELR